MLEAVQRLLEASELLQRIASVVADVRIAGIKLQRALVTVQRVLEASEVFEHIAVVVVRSRRMLICSNRASQQAGRLLCTPRLCSDDAQKAQRLKTISSRREYPSTHPLRLSPFAAGICHCRMLHSM